MSRLAKPFFAGGYRRLGWRVNRSALAGKALIGKKQLHGIVPCAAKSVRCRNAKHYGGFSLTDCNSMKKAGTKPEEICLTARTRRRLLVFFKSPLQPALSAAEQS